MSKKTKAIQWTMLGCGGLLFVFYISINLVSKSVSNNWDNQLATLIATDDSIVAFGDGAHAVPINPEDVLHVGEKSGVFGVEIVLNNAGFIKAVENTSGAWDYWFVEFTGKSISDEIQYGVNPGVESQLQYFQNGNYIWDLDEFDQRQCNYEHVMDGFEKNESFNCRLVYVVPADKRDIYWVYARTDTIVDGAYEERYVVFQIR
jgi:hypothetical protein